MQHANWQTGAKSPVVPLVKLLKSVVFLTWNWGAGLRPIPPIDFCPTVICRPFCSLGMEEFCGKSATLRALIFMITARHEVQHSQGAVGNEQVNSMTQARTASVVRNTSETQIELTINLDGTGQAELSTVCRF
ncbi:MAG: hypothetical protein CM15mP68_5760 [Pseudomonadota bacterium]|nr:MAG: hypothetical protein CM15mP68_5760 [Pseudomonadota bacterium]